MRFASLGSGSAGNATIVQVNNSRLILDCGFSVRELILRLQKLSLPETHAITINIIDSHTCFSVDDIQVSPFPVPHDAREPTQFTFSDGQSKLWILTDVGCSTPHIERVLSGCDALMLECNHDLTMLEKGPYAKPLKDRVGGRLGHLDNQTAAALLAKLDNSKLKHIVAAHLSAKNNTPELAKLALSQILNTDTDWVGIADQETGFDWRSCQAA
ncbi:MAG: MBL fold metallo-hydrolase [Methylophilales bacterium 16-45-7]|nr:MAG: MBL fold metallo-hydrolase [Methylophilales bacterium 16-45-7]